MNKQKLVVLATFVMSFYGELSHSFVGNAHPIHEQHSILFPRTIDVYEISGRVQYIEINNVVLATRTLW